MIVMFVNEGGRKNYFAGRKSTFRPLPFKLHGIYAYGKNTLPDWFVTFRPHAYKLSLVGRKWVRKGLLSVHVVENNYYLVANEIMYNNKQKKILIQASNYYWNKLMYTYFG